VRAAETDTARGGVILAYSHALHRACSGRDGAEPQNAGYGELFRYLYEVAHWRYPDVGEEAAQSALVHVFTAFERCRKPGAFLAFALQHLMNAARTARRQRQGPGAAHGGETPLDDQAGSQAHDGADPALAVIRRELREGFARLADAFLRRHPRARRQLDALRLKYLDGMDDAAIARALGVPAHTVYVLRSRAAAKIRAEPEWRALAAEFGLLPSATEVQDLPRARTFGGEH
jgi:RNA polymerase sigma factor (sigma-70 family)